MNSELTPKYIIINSILLVVAIGISSFILGVVSVLRYSYHPNADHFFYGYTFFWIVLISIVVLVLNIIIFFIKIPRRKAIYKLWILYSGSIIAALIVGYVIAEPQCDFYIKNVEGKTYQIPRYFNVSATPTDNVHITIDGELRKNEPIYGVYQPKKWGAKSYNHSSSISLRHRSDFKSFQFNYLLKNNSHIEFVDKKIKILDKPDDVMVIQSQDTVTITNISDEILKDTIKNANKRYINDYLDNPFYLQIDTEGNLKKFISCNNFGFTEYINCEHHIFQSNTVLRFSTYQTRYTIQNTVSDLLSYWETESKRAQHLIDSFQI